MAKAAKIDVKGDKALIKALNGLAVAAERRVVRSAATKSMQPVTKDAKARVKSVSKTVAKSLGAKTKTYKHSGTVTVNVGPRVGEKYVGKEGQVPSNIAHLIEKGTRRHTIKPETKQALAFEVDVDWVVTRSVEHPGTAPHPFLRPALSTKKGQVESIMRREVGKGIEREAKKAAIKK